MANNFVQNPKGSGPTPPRPRSFTEAPPEMKGQKAYDGQQTDSQSLPKTPGRTAVDIPANTPKVDAGNPIGTSIQGSNRKPFTLKG